MQQKWGKADLTWGHRYANNTFLWVYFFGEYNNLSLGSINLNHVWSTISAIPNVWQCRFSVCFSFWSNCHQLSRILVVFSCFQLITIWSKAKTGRESSLCRRPFKCQNIKMAPINEVIKCDLTWNIPALVWLIQNTLKMLIWINNYLRLSSD